MTQLADWSHGEPRILAQKCTEGHTWYLPRNRCPQCGAAVISLEPAGEGTIFAVTTLHRRSDGTPEIVRIALVDLDEGVRLMTRASETAEIGSRVRVTAERVGTNQELLPSSEVISA